MDAFIPSSRRKPEVNISIQAAQENLEACITCITAVVEIVNTGRRNVTLNYTEPPLSVRRVIFNPGGDTTLEREGIVQANYESASRVLRTEETVRYPFLVKVAAPGV
jgi:hypothetical protein